MKYGIIFIDFIERRLTMSFKEIPVAECGINPFTDLTKYCLVTAGNKEKCNPMLVTWGGFGIMWRKPVATVYIRQTRYTKTILDSQDYFTLSFLPESYKKQESYMGSHSGRDGDKFEGSGLHPAFIGDTAAGVEEADLIFVCKKIYTHEMKEEFYTNHEVYEAWNSGNHANNNHSIYMGEIVKVLKKE